MKQIISIVLCLSSIAYGTGNSPFFENPFLSENSLRDSNAVRKVLLLGIDGLRPDALRAAYTPHIDSLIENGFYSDVAQTEDVTISGPCWSSILRGVHRDKHNVTTNDLEGNKLSLYPDFISRLEAHNPNLITASFTSWDKIHDQILPSADYRIFSNYDDDGDVKNTRALTQWLQGNHPTLKGNPDVAFIYFSDLDGAGHKYGFHPEVKEYLEELEQIDSQIGQILTALKARENYEDWLIIVVSDHGGDINGYHRGNTYEKRTVPFVVSGKHAIAGRTKRQPKVVDVSKTILYYMGVPIAEDLDGEVVGLTPIDPHKIELDTNLIFNGNAERDRGFDSIQMDQYVSGWYDPGPDQITTVKYGAEGFPIEPSGKNFFAGGKSEVSAIQQMIDVRTITESSLRFKLSADLGGWKTQKDSAQLSAYFFNSQHELLSASTIGPITNIDRNNKTTLIPLDTVGLVPTGTSYIRVELRAIRDEGEYNDGYADNLSLILYQ